MYKYTFLYIVETEKDRMSRLLESLYQRVEKSERERDEAVSSENRIKREWREHRSTHDEERDTNIETIRTLEV